MKSRIAFRSLLPVLAALLASPLPEAWSVQPAAAQDTAAKAVEPLFPLASRLGMTPPPGMTLSTAFQGFEDEKNNVFIRLISMPSQAYSEIEKTMTNQALKKQNLTVEKRESFALGDNKGTLLVVRQDADNVRLRKWLLVTPVGNLTAMVSMEIPLTAKDVYPEAAIRASLASLTLRESIPAQEQLALVPFNLRDLAGFRVAGFVPGRAVHLADGEKDATDAIEFANLAVSVAPGGPSTVGDRSNFARMAFAGPPNVTDVRVTGSEPMRIGGQPGHELRATGKNAKTGAEIEIVQWLRFGSGAYIQMIGFAPKDAWIPAFTRFRTVRDALDLR
jgi:hypothetical protein